MWFPQPSPVTDENKQLVRNFAEDIFDRGPRALHHQRLEYFRVKKLSKNAEGVRMILRYFWVEGLVVQDMHHELNRLMNRKVLSNDLQEVGHVVAIDEESFIISRGDDNEYRIPKWRVERLLGNDVLVVDFRLNDLLLVELASLSYRTDGVK